MVNASLKTLAVFDRKRLLAVAENAARFTPRNRKDGCHEVLQTARFSVAGCHADIITTTLDNSAFQVCPLCANDTEPATFCLHVAALVSALKGSKSETIAVASNGGGIVGPLLIVDDICSIPLPGPLDPAEFPTFTHAGNFGGVRIQSSELIDAIRSTAFACDPSPNRYAMEGVQLEVADGMLHFVATDGHRLPVYSHKLADPGSGPDKVSTLVPGAALEKMASNLASLPDEPVWIQFGEHDASFVAGTCEYRIRTLEGRFPRWRDAMPSITQFTRIDALALRDALKRLLPLWREDSPGIDLEFWDGHVTVRSGAEPDSTINVPITTDASAFGTIIFDARFVLDALAVVRDKRPRNDHGNCPLIEFAWKNADCAALFSYGNVRHVLMPLARHR